MCTSKLEKTMSYVSLMTRNAKSFWRWIKNINAPKSIIPEIVHLGKVANSDVEKQHFQQLLCSIFTREDTSGLADLKAQLPYSLNSITFVSISADNVFRELYRIDPTKSSGPDSIPGRLLKEGAPFIDESLGDLYSRSISERKLPTIGRLQMLFLYTKKVTGGTPKTIGQLAYLHWSLKY